MSSTPSRIDYYLVAKAQACATGANAHEVHKLLACYYGYAAMAANDPACGERMRLLEQRLRALSRCDRVPRAA